MDLPTDRQYSKEHEWALLEADGTVRVGITEFAQRELGDVIYVELPAAGAQVKQNEKMGEIESVKAVSELFSPVSGEVLEVNAVVKNKPELVNDDPYDAGWLLRVKSENTDELASLLDSAAYQSITE